MLLFIVSGLLFFVGFEMGGFQLVLRNASGDFNMTIAGAGLLVAAQHLGVVLMPPLFGRLSDRIGKKRVLLLSSSVFCGGCALAAVTSGAPAFIAGVVLIGAGYSVCEATGSAALADAYPEKSAKYINLSQCALSAGAVISPVITQRCIGAFQWDWRMVFVICAIAVLPFIGMLFGLRFVSPVTDADRNETDPAPHTNFFAAPIYRMLFCSILLYVGLESGVGYFTESLFALSLQSDTLGAFAISAYWASMALSRLICGLNTLPVYRTLTIGFVASAILFAVLAATAAPYCAILLCALIGFTFGPLWSMLMDAAAKQFPSRTGGAIGLMSAGCGVGGMVFPALMGFVADEMRIRDAFILLVVAAIVAAGLCYAAFRRTKRT